MENILAIVFPFVKNLSILYLTVFMLFFGTALVKNKGLTGFSFAFWLRDNKNRFITGAIFILGLSFLMAMTDVAPLFQFFGFDINASPVGLGMSIAVLLGLAPTDSKTTSKAHKAKEIQGKASEIIEKSAEIVKEEKGE